MRSDQIPLAKWRSVLDESFGRISNKETSETALTEKETLLERLKLREIGTSLHEEGPKEAMELGGRVDV
jgi:hypothetical protein